MWCNWPWCVLTSDRCKLPIPRVIHQDYVEATNISVTKWAIHCVLTRKHADKPLRFAEVGLQQILIWCWKRFNSYNRIEGMVVSCRLLRNRTGNQQLQTSLSMPNLPCFTWDEKKSIYRFCISFQRCNRFPSKASQQVTWKCKENWWCDFFSTKTRFGADCVWDVIVF